MGLATTQVFARFGHDRGAFTPKSLLFDGDHFRVRAITATMNASGDPPLGAPAEIMLASAKALAVQAAARVSRTRKRDHL